MYLCVYNALITIAVQLAIRRDDHAVWHFAGRFEDAVVAAKHYDKVRLLVWDS